MASNFFTGAVDANWGTAGNWSLAAVPTAADGNVATFNAASPNCTVNASARVCNGIDFKGAGVTDYAATITMTNQITVSGNVTLAAGMGVAGVGALLVNATSTMTSSGKTWPNALTLSGAITYTLADNWDVNGTLTIGTSGATTTVAGAFTISTGGSFVFGAGSGTVTGAASFVMDGTGTLTTSSSGSSTNNLTINTAGTITISSAIRYNTGTFTYTAGTVNWAGSTLTITASTTLALNGTTLDAITATGTTTITLSNNLTMTGLLSLGSTSATLTLNGNNIYSSGGIRHTGTSGINTGTTVLHATGTSTLDGPSVSTGVIRNPLTLNAPGGTITIATAGDTFFPVLLNQVNYIAGTITTDVATWTAVGGGGVTVGGTPMRRGMV